MYSASSSSKPSPPEVGGGLCGRSSGAVREEEERRPVARTRATASIGTRDRMGAPRRRSGRSRAATCRRRRTRRPWFRRTASSCVPPRPQPQSGSLDLDLGQVARDEAGDRGRAPDAHSRLRGDSARGAASIASTCSSGSIIRSRSSSSEMSRPEAVAGGRETDAVTLVLEHLGPRRAEHARRAHPGRSPPEADRTGRARSARPRPAPATSAPRS